MNIYVKEVTTKKELKSFIRFNLDLYQHCPYHVPGLIEEEMMTLSRDKNPAFETSEAVYFLAYKNDYIAGRIACIINHKSNETWKQKYARFGFVDFIDDADVVDRLFDAAEKWAKDKGMEAIHGPLGFTDLDHEGMLVDGFYQMATMATIYNYSYYPKHLMRRGYEKDLDWKEFKIYIPIHMPTRHERIGEIVMMKYGLKIRKFKKRKELWAYAPRIFEALNKAYAPLYGFVELSEKQIRYYSKMYIPMLRLDMITLIVREADDAVIGFGITMPNLSLALRKAGGSLWPFGFIHLLKALYSPPKVVDLYLIGVIPEYQSRGVNSLLFTDLIPVYQRLGVVYAESNPELETNISVQLQWEYFDCKHHKTRRVFLKKL